MARTSEEIQASFTALMDEMAADRDQYLTQPWRVRQDDREKALRRFQVYEFTKRIQPTTGRGVAYRMLASGLIKSKDDFVQVVRLVREMRLEERLPYEWITDQGRSMWEPGGADGVGDWLQANVEGYYRNAWDEVEVQVIVCVEKAALYGVFLPVAQVFDLSICATGGFNSNTRKNDIAQLIKSDARDTVLLNLGDHDESGIEVMRSSHEWMEERSGKTLVSRRVAVLPEHARRFGLSTRMMEKDEKERPHAKAVERLSQITLLNERPVFDPRLGDFDLDALDPNDARQLLGDALRHYLPDDKLAAVRRREARERAEVEKLAKNWPAVRRFLRTLP